jgi:hypothetical protein
VNREKEGISLVKVAIGPARSAIAEERIGRILEQLEVNARFVSLGSQSCKHFADCLARSPNGGILVLNSAANFLAMGAPDALFRLSEQCRLALVDGPVRLPFAKSTDATVDLVTVDWQAVAKRIVDDLTTRRPGALEQPCVFEASAQCRVPLSRFSQRL